MPATKKCIDCDQEIGESEKTCPKCGADFEATEADLKEMDRLARIAEKRRKAALPPEPEVKPEPAKRSVFRSLAPKGSK